MAASRRPVVRPCCRSNLRRSLTTLDNDSVKADVARRFGLQGGPSAGSPLSIGAEIELVPQMLGTHAPIPIVDGSGTDSVTAIRKVADEWQWVEQATDGDPPSWSLPGGARISFEPGGQIEISSARHDNASALIGELTRVIAALRDEFDRHGVALSTRGVDEWNSIDAVPLQLHRARYTRMARYFESIGASGARMMRQTASVQINVETGERPMERWKLLNALAPYLVAIFANSRHYESRDSGHASYRAHLWRTLDVSRTGVLEASDDPVSAYMQFALNAGAMVSRRDDTSYLTFGEWMTGHGTGYDDWDLHLSTLFPEIRPKGFFEIRSTDMVSPEWLAAPIAFVAGLIHDQPTSLRANEIVAQASNALLVRAGRLAQRDDAIATVSRELMLLAIIGCKQLGNGYIGGPEVETLEKFADIYTYRGRSQSDDSTL